MGSERSRATTPRPHWPLRSELLRQFAVGFMPSSVLVSKKAVPEICLLNILPCGKTLREGKLSPMGTLKCPRTEQEREAIIHAVALVFTPSQQLPRSRQARVLRW